MTFEEAYEQLHRIGIKAVAAEMASWHPAILGQMDGSGKVLFPRQQLCLTDALWASSGGPTGTPSDQPNRLFMSAFGPALDYQVATKLRRDTMRWSINEGVTGRFLTEFGFTPDDLPGDGRVIDAMDYSG